MTDERTLKDRLDTLAERGVERLRQDVGRDAKPTAGLRAIQIMAAIPAGYLIVEILRWQSRAEPYPIAFRTLALVAIAVGLVAAFQYWREQWQKPQTRGAGLLEADRRLDLGEQMTTADEFLGREKLGSFEQAAVEDAAELAEAAVQRPFPHDFSKASSPESEEMRKALLAGVIGIACALLAALVAESDRGRLNGAGPEIAITESGNDPAESNDPDTDPDRQEDPPPETPEDENRDRVPPTGNSGEAPKPRPTSPSKDDRKKESTGRTGSGRSTQAESSSSASDARAQSANQSQTPQDPSEKKESPSKPKKPKPKKTNPKKKETPPSSEQAGANSGRGASRGSTDNPTISAWQTKDKVEAPDETELENEDEVDDEDEEQEARGGVQPNLRDRKPPVNRDLRIGFGNRPDPDANGRGGPSEQKKSRGVASLVLGVPIPDRVKGQPNPGRVKITQERIEPTEEEARPQIASSRGMRTDPLGPVVRHELNAWMRAVVRRYFARP